MFHKDNPEYNRRQIGFYTLDELVPKDHFLRKVEETIDFSFIYVVVNQKAKFMSEQLDIEINLDRKKHAKKARLNLRNNQRQTQIVVGFTRENTRKSSLIMLR